MMGLPQWGMEVKERGVRRLITDLADGTDGRGPNVTVGFFISLPQKNARERRGGKILNVKERWRHFLRVVFFGGEVGLRFWRRTAFSQFGKRVFARGLVVNVGLNGKCQRG